MYYPLAHDSWNWKEKLAILKVMASGRYTMGENVKKFEEAFAERMGVKNAIMTNSGSSANLLALASLVYYKNYNVTEGDEVIVPAISWSTTYFPITQLGLIPVFVDVELDTFNISVKEVKQAITDKTRIIFAVNLLGLPAGLLELKTICQEKNIVLVEDNCESLGSKIGGFNTGTIGTLGTYSFFFSHHLQTMEGGMVVTNDHILADHLRALRAHGWVRDLKTNYLYTKTGVPFYDSFKFVLPGYCVRPLEMSGAIGIEQLKKLDGFVEKRRKNAELFKEEFDENFIIQKEGPDILSSWFGFGIVLKDLLEGKRMKIIKHLARNGIETRPIVSGNFVRQPVMKLIPHRVSGVLFNATYIDQNGFFIGNDDRDLRRHINRTRRVIKEVTFI